MLPKVGDYVLVRDISESRKVDDVSEYATGWVVQMNAFVGKIAVVEEVQSANYCRLHYVSGGGNNTVRLKLSNFSIKMATMDTVGGHYSWWFCVEHLELLPDFVDLD